MSEANLSVTSVEQDGRTLSGVGVKADALKAVMERHALPEAPTEQATTEPSTEQVAQPDPQPKGRQRYSELTKARDEAKAEADRVKAEKEALALELAELKSKPAAQAPAARPDPVAAPAPAATTADEFTFPSYEEHIQAHPNDSYDQWRRKELLAFSDWKDARANLDDRIRKTLESERERYEFQSTINRTFAKGRESYADFDAMLENGPGSGVLLGPTPDEAKARVHFIVHHPQSEHLQYAIMKDGDLARRLAAMSPIEFGLEVARLIPSAQPAQSRTVAPPPAPYQPVNGSTPTTAPASADLAKKSGFDFDKSGYRERRAAERRAARR